MQIFASPEDADLATRRAYRAMTPNDRGALTLTLTLQRRYDEQHPD